MKKKIVALVPMRHHSERVPGKNYRLFNGKPLYHYVITALLGCPLIDTIVIDTDSPEILKDAQNHFPQICLIERPGHLRDGTIPMNDILLNDTKSIQADFYLQTHSTNPLVHSKTFTDALNLFLDSYPVYDSLFAVTKMQTRLWDGLARPINHNPAILLRTQDLPPVFEENSCMYVFTRETLEAKHNRIGERPLMYEIDPVEAWDIDEELDFRVAEFLYREREQSP